LHGRAGKHSFGAGHVPAVRADVNGPDRLTIDRVQGHDPDRIAVRVGPQSIARAVEAKSRFLGDVTGHLKRATRIEIQARGVDGRAFRGTNHRAWPFGSDPAIFDDNFLEPRADW